jgi:hypothetical protein
VNREHTVSLQDVNEASESDKLMLRLITPVLKLYAGKQVH